MKKLAACLLFAIATSAGCLDTDEADTEKPWGCEITDTCEDEVPPSEEEETKKPWGCEITDTCED